MHRRFHSSLALVLLCATVQAEEVAREGAEALTWNMKMTCGTTEPNVVRYGFWEGRLYSRVPGEKDRHLFDVFGVNVRQCAALQDPARGAGYRSVSREIMVYLDPQTGEIVDRWKNPWTGEEVEVIHVANDPVNMREAAYVTGKDGKPARTRLRRYEDTLVSSSEVPLFYTNPLTGPYQDYVGGQYHAMEIFNTFYRAADFLDPTVTRIGDSRLAWQRVSQMLPWMKMGDRPGLMVFNATGFSTFEPAKLPPRLWKVVDERFPAYRTPPPTDDARPNETTWTVFKKTIDSRAKAPPAN